MNENDDNKNNEKNSKELAPDFVDRRKDRVDRRTNDKPIDFPDRRKSSRRAPVLGLDFQEEAELKKLKTYNKYTLKEQMMADISVDISVKQALKGQIEFDTIVTVKGWVRTRRDSKAGFSFINLHDGSCFDGIQVIADNLSLIHI